MTKVLNHSGQRIGGRPKSCSRSLVTRDQENWPYVSMKVTQVNMMLWVLMLYADIVEKVAKSSNITLEFQTRSGHGFQMLTCVRKC